MACLDENQLTAYLQRDLDAAAKRAADAHLARCEACRAIVEDLGDAFGATSGDRPATLPGGPHTFGRYVLLGTVGAGAFGVVYLAFDPQLDRQVALKVARGAAHPQEAAAALVREAQAMGRMAHPNVTTVFDVTTVDGQLAIAMELIEGQTLREWLSSAKRPWREVLRIFEAAGRGLAAAHAQGVVHRDFKPANVLIGAQGRVAVTDFGLARVGERGERGVAGTPAYMAPEQLRGDDVDARADQYAFAVALWEALSGVRPAAGAQAPGAIPKSVRRPLVRALELDRERRYGSMEALLDALAQDRPEPWRKPLRLSGAAALLFSPIAVAWAWSDYRDALCSGAQAQVDAEWSRARQERLAGLFDPNQWSEVRPRVQRWWDRWARLHTSACEATRLREEMPEDVLAARMACLDAARGEVAALLEATERAQAATVPQAARSLGSLEPVDRCMDAGPLLREERASGELAAHVQEVRNQIARAKAARDLGQLAAANTLAHRLSARAAELSFAPLLGEALLFEGQGRMMLGDARGAEALVLKAARYATRGRSDRVAAQAWIDALQIASRTSGASSLPGYRHAASVAAERVAGDAVIDARLGMALGYSLALEGRLLEALEQHRRAVSASERAFGSGAPEVGPQRLKLAELLADLGYADEAEAAGRTALGEISRAYGERHPLQSLAWSALSDAALWRGDAQDALEKAKQALKLRQEASHGKDFALLPRYLSVAAAAVAAERWDDAERALDAAELLTDSEAWHCRTAAWRAAMSVKRREAGSLPRLEAASRRVVASLGPSHLDAVRIRFALARAHRRTADIDALAQDVEKTYGAEAPLATLLKNGTGYFSRER